jgi:hypothetical protein
MYKLHLFSPGEKVPEWWERFAVVHRETNYKTLDEDLVRHGAKFEIEIKDSGRYHGERYLLFENEDAALLFLLKVMK